MNERKRETERLCIDYFLYKFVFLTSSPYFVYERNQKSIILLNYCVDVYLLFPSVPGSAQVLQTHYRRFTMIDRFGVFTCITSL